MLCQINNLSNCKYYLKIIENTTKDKTRNKNDKLFKIHPVTEAVRKITWP